MEIARHLEKESKSWDHGVESGASSTPPRVESGQAPQGRDHTPRASDILREPKSLPDREVSSFSSIKDLVEAYDTKDEQKKQGVFFQAKRVVEAFSNAKNKTPGMTWGMLPLIHLQNKEITRGLLNALIQKISEEGLDEEAWYEGIIQIVAYEAFDKVLDSSDLVALLNVVVKKLNTLYIAPGVKQLPQLEAIAAVLDVMSEMGVEQIPKQSVKNGTYQAIERFEKKGYEISLRASASRCKQALARISSDESRGEMVGRKMGKIIRGFLGTGIFVTRVVTGEPLIETFLGLADAGLGGASDIGKTFSAFKEALHIKRREKRWYNLSGTLDAAFIKARGKEGKFQEMLHGVIELRDQQKWKGESWLLLYSLAQNFRNVVFSDPCEANAEKALQMLESMFQDKESWGGNALMREGVLLMLQEILTQGPLPWAEKACTILKSIREEHQSKTNRLGRPTSRAQLVNKYVGDDAHLEAASQKPRPQWAPSNEADPLLTSEVQKAGANSSKGQEALLKQISELRKHLEVIPHLEGLPQASGLREMQAFTGIAQQVKKKALNRQVYLFPSLPEHYTKRETKFNKIQASLEKVHLGRVPMCAITGPSGSGKTTLATAYAHEHRDKYGLIFLIHGEEPIEEQYKRLGQDLGLLIEEDKPAEACEQVRRVLSQRKDWLLLIDNAVGDPERYRRYFPDAPVRQEGVQVGIIITSRDSRLGNSVSLDSFMEEEAVDFLCQSFNQDNPSFRAQSLELAQELICFPLALAQAVGYITSNPSRDIPSYLELYRSERSRIEEEEKAPESYARRSKLSREEATLQSTLHLNWNAINDTNPEAFKLLQLCAYLASEDISKEVFEGYANFIKGDWGACVDFLSQYSLLTYSQKDQTGKIHRMVQEALQTEMSRQPEGERPFIEMALDILFPLFPYDEEDSRRFPLQPEIAALVPHVTTILSHVDRVGWKKGEKLIWMHNRMGHLLLDQGKYQEAEPYFQQAMALCHEPNTNPALLARIHNSMGILRDRQRRYDGDDSAESHYDEALKIRLKIHAANLNHEDIAISYNNLATLFHAREQAEKAEEYFKSSISIWKEIDKDNTELAIAHFNLGNLLLSESKVKEAEEHLTRSLEIRNLAYRDNPHHPHLAQSYLSLGKLRQVQNRYDGDEGAEAYFQKAWRIFKVIHENNLNHPDLAEIHINLGELQQLQGRYDGEDGAEAHFQAALRIYEAAHQNNPNHPDLGGSHIALGSLRRAQGQWDGDDGAEAHFQKALPIYQEIHATNPRHGGLAFIHLLLGNLKEAQDQIEGDGGALYHLRESLKFSKEIHSDNPHHQDVARVLYQLGKLLKTLAEKKEGLGNTDQANLLRQEAGEHLKQALAIFEKIDSSNHYETQGDIHAALVEIRQAQGQLLGEDGWLSHSKAALESYKKILPSDHPILVTLHTTLAAMQPFEFGQEEKGQPEDHLEIAQKVLRETREANPNDPQLVTAHHTLGLLRQQQFQILGDDGALYHFQEALRISQEVVHQDNPHHPELADAHHCLGVLFQDQHCYGDAFYHFQKASLILIEVYGENSEHPDLVQALSAIERVLEIQEEEEKAKKLERARGHQERGKQLQAEGRYDGDGGAHYHFQEALRILRGVYADNLNHPDLAQVHRRLGNLQQLQSRYDGNDGAHHHFQEAVRILGIAHAGHPNHPDLVAARQEFNALWWNETLDYLRCEIL